MLTPWQASAQSPQTKPANTPHVLPAITVTDGSTQPSAFTQPGSLDVIKGEDLQLRRIERVEDLQSRAPNLVARSGGTRSLNLVLGFRGMVNNAFYGDPAVPLYLDDVPYGVTLSYDTAFLDIDHVDVLRGPQFTRWGKQGPAGLIAAYSEGPGEKFSVRAEAGFANHDEQYYKARFAGPITPTLGFTLSGMYSKRDGFLYNERNDVRPDYEDGFSGRFSLHWNPDDRWEIKAIVSGQHFDDGAQRFTNLDDDPFTISHDFNGVTRTRSDMQSFQVKYTGDDLLFTMISARRNYRIDPGCFDLDGTPLPIMPLSVVAQHVTYSEELRLQPTRPDKWDWFLGAFASHTDFDIFVEESIFEGTSEMIDKSIAVYGELTRKFDNHVDVTMGLRGEIIEKSATRELLNPGGITTHEDLSHTVSNLSPKLAVNWRPQQNLLLYGSTSLSYRAGPYSVFNFHPKILSAETERTWANEIGAKARFFDNKLELALAGFWYQIQNYQIERYVLGGFGVFNAEEVETRGVEFEARWRPIEGLELSAGIGYVDARFTDHHNPLTGENLSGKRPPYIPDFTANLAAQYRHRCGFVARAEWIFTGDAYFEDENLNDMSQDGFGLFNARIGYEKEHWGIYLYGNNLTDTEYYSLKIRVLGAGIPGEPRSVGLIVKTEF